MLRIVGTNVGLRYAYPTYKTDPPALSLRQDFSSDRCLEPSDLRGIARLLEAHFQYE
jgi:hypothetical protein